MSNIKIAIVGSRKTNAEIMKLMTNGLCEIIEHYDNVLLTSGGCWLGPDTIALNLSKHTSCEIYLPDDKKLYLKRYYPKANFFVHTPNKNYKEIVDKIHPNPSALVDFTYRLHGRNIDIISRMGKGNVDCVYFAAPVDKKGNIKGGTATACNYAKTLNIPIFNAITDNDKFIDFVNNFV